MERIERQMDFLREIDGLKQVGRQSYLADGSRKENDAEHSWHLAVMALLLGEYANGTADCFRVMSMVLVHDIVELDAGDTYAYDEAGNATKKEREQKAADRIFALLPKDQEALLRGLWDEFEANETPEAKFAHALDNIQPMMLNAASGGRAWREHQVRLSQILRRQEKTAEGSEALWEYAREELLRPHLEGGAIVPDTELSGTAPI